MTMGLIRLTIPVGTTRILKLKMSIPPVIVKLGELGAFPIENDII
jgi:hypothetical protein